MKLIKSYKKEEKIFGFKLDEGTRAIVEILSRNVPTEEMVDLLSKITEDFDTKFGTRNEAIAKFNSYRKFLKRSRIINTIVPTVVEFVSLASIIALATQATYGIGYKHGVNNNLLEDGRRLFLDYLAESARKNPDGKVIKITNEVTDEVAYLVTKFVTEKPETFNDNDLTKLA